MWNELTHLARRSVAFPHLLRAIRSCEKFDYESALSHYENYAVKAGRERADDRAFHAMLFVLNREYGLAVEKLQRLIADLEIRPQLNEDEALGYVHAWSKMTLAGLTGKQSRMQFRDLALSKRPPNYVKKKLPVGN